MNSAARSLSAWSATVALIYGCVPELDDDPSRAVEGQILAVQFEPAEVKPEATTQVNALVATKDNDLAGDVSFSLCVARKPLSELGPVHPACLGSVEDDEALQPIGSGASVSLSVPKNACGLFGPQRPPAEPGQPPGRPVDPDATGGFYQPVIATLGDAVLGSLRLDCGLPGGAQDQVAQYNQEHEANQNPAATKLEIRVQGGEWQSLAVSEADAIRVPRNRAINVRATWGERERYLFLSTETRELTHKNEALVATFYSTVGGFGEHRVGVDKKGRVESEFVTPSKSGEVRVWIVARDGRSGAGWASFDLDVR